MEADIIRVIIGAIKITRPLNCLSALGSVILGGYLATDLNTPRIWIAAVVAATLTAAGNVVNDYFDVETDRINKPFRVLPSGQLRPDVARWWAMVLVTVGLGLSVLLDMVMVATAMIMAVLLYAYSQKLKQTVLVGNAVVSVMSATTVVYGGMAVGSIGPTLVPALLILLFMFCREILKTVEDYGGDRQIGVRTVAVVWGKMGALRVFSVLAASVAFLSPLPWILGSVSVVYLILVVPGVSLVLLLAAFVLLRQPTRRYIRMTLVITKVDWILWTAAMFIGIRSKL